jgi:deazaflavin-dependent oxidoreductase (nitroreductase family)
VASPLVESEMAMSTPPRVAAGISAVFIFGAIVRRVRIAAGMRRGDQAVIDAKLKRNKRFANKMVTRVGRAGRPHSVFAIMECTGRRTGRTYTTPIRVVEQPGNYVVPLTYGRKTSWYVNLKHNPGILHWQGQAIPVSNPTLVLTATVAHLLPPPSRFLLWLDGTDECVRIPKHSRSASDIAWHPDESAEGQAAT